ncbi:MAG TPA: NADH-quinone oxidoreductase subunit H [Planctomycetota bacterium]|jgi:formate hydrogenlyase subunit 4|nr:NADH-quinone oxidoreductase subunit H [Planctomycetota bacterium]OQC20148.1 MAG: Formate hydrogenlyase subunit 4 [Planctomycetes bacterium ADurb.Bin069]NMD36833.1 hydrogenase [Planctomycetota bacterium]HNR99290.1 NADH-quinone oxidoreductase subunit H [Planctomycetota bacterium]HNU26095.1 NADH-quinone oxidoreductase subunit H [Planctomycetota bacterium]
MRIESAVHFAAALVFAPLLLGIINRTKALVAGRTGPPLLQAYFDIFKLLGKGAVYSRATTWVFRLGPAAGLAAVALALAFIPFGGAPALFPFSGDFLLVVYLLAAARFATVAAALDTGSSFEGMGASRETQFSALAEPALLLGIIAVARAASGAESLSACLGAIDGRTWAASGPALALAAAAWFTVFLAENARIPVDDPQTHLELTMIHEVMVLDHGGPDLGYIHYAAALKMWVLGALLAALLIPVRTGVWAIDGAAAAAGMVLLAVLVGVVESSMARLRLVRVPQLLIAASTLSVLALILLMR